MVVDYNITHAIKHACETYTRLQKSIFIESLD